MKKVLLATALLALSGSVAPGLAQLPNPLQFGLINVNLSNVANDLALQLHVDRSNIPVTVQVPINLAANVCGVNINILAVQSSGGNNNCSATTGSQELVQIVSMQMTAGGPAPAPAPAAPATTAAPAPAPAPAAAPAPQTAQTPPPAVAPAPTAPVAAPAPQPPATQ